VAEIVVRVLEAVQVVVAAAAIAVVEMDAEAKAGMEAMVVAVGVRIVCHEFKTAAQVAVFSFANRSGARPI
jgi:hypothetical protein